MIEDHLHVAFDISGIITCFVTLVKVGRLDQKVTTMWHWFEGNIINDRRKSKRD